MLTRNLVMEKLRDLKQSNKLYLNYNGIPGFYRNFNTIERLLCTYPVSLQFGSSTIQADAL